MSALLVVFIGYLLGSVPVGVLITRRIKPDVDLRSIGSGNIGATNVSRALGAKWGVVTMLCDTLKGLLPVLFARWIGAPPVAIAAAGVAAFVGHVYPVYMSFNGGKGVATSLGIFLGLAPIVALLALFIWVCGSLIARTTTVGSLSAALAIPILIIGASPQGPLRGPAIIAAFILTPFVFYTHRENIRKILRGETQPGKEANNG